MFTNIRPGVIYYSGIVYLKTVNVVGRRILLSSRASSSPFRLFFLVTINKFRSSEFFPLLLDPFLRTKIDDNIDVFLIIPTFNILFPSPPKNDGNKGRKTKRNPSLSYSPGSPTRILHDHHRPQLLSRDN